MNIKPGASLQGLHISMRKVLIHADSIWKAHGIEGGVTITSGTDGTHGAGSWHYYGLAVDLRTRDLIAAGISVPDVAKELDEALGNGYDVLNEGNHIHVEADAVARKLEKGWDE